MNFFLAISFPELFFFLIFVFIAMFIENKAVIRTYNFR